jgi:glycosyltransferase involved in cell wall biosynthesis
MKKSENLLSVIITTYNRYELLKEAIDKVKEQTYKNIEIIISDDCSDDGTPKIEKEYVGIKYIKTPQNLGYAKNSLFALEHASGEYVIFLSDDDILKDDTFFEKAMERFEEDRDIDSVFGRVAIRNGDEIIVNRFGFQNEYKSQEFIKQIVALNFYFLDYFAFSSFIFKKEYFEKIKPFESIYEDSSSIDISSVIKYLYITKKVAFIDLVVYEWKRSNANSIGGVKRDDLTYQTLQLVSAGIDIYNFIQDKTECVDVCNAYMEHAFSMILSYKEQLKNKENFQKLLPQLDNNDIYIYGRGWAGLELKSFLIESDKEFKYFIDDTKEGFEDTISYEDFLHVKKNIVVIIATYKYKWLYKIYKKLSTCKNVKILDLVSE